MESGFLGFPQRSAGPQCHGKSRLESEPRLVGAARLVICCCSSGFAQDYHCTNAYITLQVLVNVKRYIPNNV